MKRTYKLKLYSGIDDVAIFDNYIERQFNALQWWVKRIWKSGHTRMSELHTSFYRESRQKFSIGATCTQLAMVQAIRLVRVAKKHGRDIPHPKKKYGIFNKVEVNMDKIGFIAMDMTKRKRCWFVFRGMKLPETFRILESKVVCNEKEYYCYLSVEIAGIALRKVGHYLGIDLGVVRQAVTSNSAGNVIKFFDGRSSHKTRQHYQDLRSNLQEDLKKGNVYKKLKRIRHHESSWMRETNHKISKEIVEMAYEGGYGIALENLRGITTRLKLNKKTKKMVMGWSFRQLANMIEYKAEERGIPVVYVDPRGTSTTCPKCLYSHKRNRTKQAIFSCKECGYTSNADRVGAMNIARIAETQL